MPVYEYDCDKCGKRSELLRKMADADEPAKCEHCGSIRTHRAHSVFTAAAGAPSGSAIPGGAGPCGRCGDPGGSCPMM